LFFSRKLRFLVTGGCGYFAFHLAKSLYALGAHVCILDLHLPLEVEKVLGDRFTFIKVFNITSFYVDFINNYVNHYTTCNYANLLNSKLKFLAVNTTYGCRKIVQDIEGDSQL